MAFEEMKGGNRGSGVVWSWLSTACDVAVVVAGMLLAYFILQRMAPGRNILKEEIKWYCSVAALSYIILSFYLPPVVTRLAVRVDEMMQRCFRKVVLMFVFMCAALTFLKCVIIVHGFLALFSALSFVLLLAEWLMVRFCLQLAHRREVELRNGEWEVVMVPVSEEPLQSMGNRFVKRLFDICFSLLFLLTLFPIIYIVVFIIVKAKRRGPVLAASKCSGMNGKVFSCIRFRHVRGAVGCMPMFMDVLIGRMSVVGSLSCPSACREQYEEKVAESAVHCPVKAGVINWARLNLPTDIQNSMDLCVKRDVWYAENWSFWLDVCIILKTLMGKRNIMHD